MPGDPHLCHEVLIYFYIHVKDVPGFCHLSPVFPLSLFFLFLAVERWLFTLFCEWAGLFRLLDLYDTYKVHDEAMKFNFAEGAHCDGRCITVGLRLYLSSYRSEHLSRISWK